MKQQTGNAREAGSAGCNRYHGSYKKSGQQISFGKMGVTMMACVNGMETEQTFLAMLEAAAQWRLVEGQYSIRDTQCVELGRFR